MSSGHAQLTASLEMVHVTGMRHILCLIGQAVVLPLYKEVLLVIDSSKLTIWIKDTMGAWLCLHAEQLHV